MEVLTLDEFINSSGEKIMDIQIPHDDENFLGRFRVIDRCDCAEDKSYYFYAYVTSIGPSIDVLRIMSIYYGSFLLCKPYGYALNLLRTGELRDPSNSEVLLIKAAKNNIDTHWQF